MRFGAADNWIPTRLLSCSCNGHSLCSTRVASALELARFKPDSQMHERVFLYLRIRTYFSPILSPKTLGWLPGRRLDSSRRTERMTVSGVSSGPPCSIARLNARSLACARGLNIFVSTKTLRSPVVCLERKKDDLSS